MDKAIIKKIKSESDSIRTITLDLMTPMSFMPGQTITLFVGEAKAAYSLSSAPSQNKSITITVKFHKDGGFTPKLAKKKVGDSLRYIGPYGVFNLDENNKEHYLIAGGIGITPFHSMIMDSLKKRFLKKINLIYCAKNSDELTFKRDFDKIKNKNFNSYYTITREDPSWKGDRGRLSRDKLDNIITDKNSRFLICGSPGFNDSIKKFLLSLDIDNKNIKVDKWI